MSKEKTSNSAPEDLERDERDCCRCHMNTLGSIVYCIVVLALSAYVITTEIQQFVKYLTLPWPNRIEPFIELNVHIGLVAVAALLLPFFFSAAVFKTGNCANDGYRLGVHDACCSRDPPPLPPPSNGLASTVWHHGGPTAPFLHLVISFALLVARMVMEATAIRDHFLPEDVVWTNELSALLPATFPSHIAMPAKDEATRMKLDESTEATLKDGEDRESSLSHEDAWNIGEIPWGPLTPHLISHVLAQLVYAVKYSSVFWSSHKGFGFLMMLQLTLNALQNVFSFNGFQVLYKVHVVGTERVLPQAEEFLLPMPFAAGAFVASQTLVLASGTIIYFYGYVKFQDFLSSEKEKYHILSRHGHQNLWGYWPHFCSVSVLAMTTAVSSPLVYDWTVVYRASLDTAVLVATCSTVAHLFVWIFVWMLLTLKVRWCFKLKVQVAKTFVTGSHSIRLVNEVHLSRKLEEKEGPVMVLAAGRTYLIGDQIPKKDLMKVVLDTVREKKARGEEDEIYWLRPQCAAGTPGWNKWSESGGTKHKVTFDETPSTHKKRSSKGGGGGEADDASDAETSESDGDYARLRNVTFPGPTTSDINSPTSPKMAESGAALKIEQPDAEVLSINSDFPEPPPELTDPSRYPPPPDTPPPPLPNQNKCNPAPPPLLCSSIQPQIQITKESQARPSPGSVEAPDSSSLSSSITPPDKRCDSGIHSQASTSSSSGSHSKSGSSGSESCVLPPPSNETNSALNEDSPRRPHDFPHNSSPSQDALPGNGDPRRNSKVAIEVLGGGYGFLPPSKYISSEPIYSDASTPVVIRRRSSVTAVEPETPPYERTAGSFSTFTDPPLSRAFLRGAAGFHHNMNHGKALTVGGPLGRNKRPPSADSKHATIASADLPKGFHQAHFDSRYFSIPAVKPPGTKIHPAPQPSSPSFYPSLQ